MHSPSGSKFVDYYGVEFEFYYLLHQTFFHPKSVSIAYIHLKINDRAFIRYGKVHDLQKTYRLFS